jgi:hypothetical protein
MIVKHFAFFCMHSKQLFEADIVIVPDKGIDV